LIKKHPRDTYITVYGRKPVLEVLEQNNIQIAKVLLAKKAKGSIIKNILACCTKRAIEVQRLSPEEVSRISKNPKQDQGIVADVIVPQMDSTERYFQRPIAQQDYWLALDGITTPSNIGMIIRSATALGMGIILPLKGSAKITPLMIKASAGVIFKSRLLKCQHLRDALPSAKAQGYHIFGLAGEEGTSIYIYL